MTSEEIVIFCKEMKNISQKVYAFIENVPSVQEESITEYLMWQWNILDKKVKFIKGKRLHSKSEESTTGTDVEIELWLLKGTMAIPFLIQAKKIVKNTNSYCVQSLNYNHKKSTKQYQLLIDTATREKKVPLYMFYTNKGIEKSIYISKAEEVKKLAEACFNTPKSAKVTKLDILDISTNIIKCFCFGSLLQEESLYSNFQIEQDSIPEYVRTSLDNNSETSDEIPNRDLVILDYRTPSKETK